MYGFAASTGAGGTEVCSIPSSVRPLGSRSEAMRGATCEDRERPSQSPAAAQRATVPRLQHSPRARARAQARRGLTPLMLAASHGNWEVGAVLIRRGAAMSAVAGKCTASCAAAA